MSKLPWTTEDLDKDPNENPQQYKEMLVRIAPTKRDAPLVMLFRAERSVRRIRTGGSRCSSGDDPVLCYYRELQNRAR